MHKNATNEIEFAGSTQLVMTTTVYTISGQNIDFIILLTFLSGRLNRNSRSNRPGLLRAGSIESSLFVAPMTTISPRLSKPSINASRVDTIELNKENMKMSQKVLGCFKQTLTKDRKTNKKENHQTHHPMITRANVLK